MLEARPGVCQKKTLEERKASSAKAFAHPRGAYGSRVARHIASVMAVNMIGPAAGQTEPNVWIDLGQYGILATNVHIILALFMVPMFIILMMALIDYIRARLLPEHSQPIRGTTTITTTSTAVQTNEDFERLQRMWRTQAAVIQDLRNYIARKDEEVQRLREQVRDANARAADALAAIPPPAPHGHGQPDGGVHMSPHGRVYHTSRQCGHLRDCETRAVRKCRDCP